MLRMRQPSHFKSPQWRASHTSPPTRNKSSPLINSFGEQSSSKKALFPTLRPPHHPPPSNTASPTLKAAIRFSIPSSNPAPILWSPDETTPPDDDPIIAHVDALLQPSKTSNLDLNAPHRDARKLLHDCARLRLLLASAGLALWRTCGAEHAGAIKHTLKNADRKLRRCALGIAQCLDRLGSSTPLSLLECHQELVAARSQLQAIEDQTHDGMICLCDSNPGDASSPLSFCDETLSEEIHSPTTSPTTEASTAQDEDCIALTRAYFSGQDTQDPSRIAAFCKRENNPWLWIRIQTEQLKNTPTCPTPETDDWANLEKEDRLAVRLWEACLHELGRI